MNKKHWEITLWKTTHYVSVIATSGWDSEATRQRVQAINPQNDFLAELKIQFTQRTGFEITVTPPEDSRLIGNFQVLRHV